MHLFKTVVFTALALRCAGQSLPLASGSQDASPSRSAGAPEVPTRVLDFRKGSVIKGLHASHIIVLPYQVSGDGAVFVNMMEAKTAETILYEIDGDTSHTFDFSSVRDMSDIQVLDYFPSDTHVLFLVSAASAPQAAGSDVSKSLEKQRSTSNRHQQFFLEFDRTGQYRRSIRPEVYFSITRIAVLSSGPIIASGYDQGIQAPRMVLLDTDGKVLRNLNQSITKDEQQTGAKGVLSANQTEFVPYKGNVLIWRRGVNDPIVEMLSDGSTREIKPELPRGTIVQDVVASDDQWLFHVAPAGPRPDGKAVNQSDMRYVEISPFDGHMIDMVEVGPGPIQSIVCRANGRYIGFLTGDDASFTRYTADAP